ncbi:cytochrome c family protein [Pseudooceanicola sp. CBS1P-1]|uniref:C-type cytochrome n=1 Tax=Pseudooceanicola albus TaxID=2692189 RepID=A0A6L7G8N9_9RHOB|nr:MULTISPECIES: cytochrome c family protein [Pseudooceanicola]MBT9386391.1 cytochrome c family protein [Pseudooceanicola endophyticus]MXN20451.1 c-type cytochrome [Pseudooceanicola albus]
MFDTMTFTKIVGGFCGTLLVFLLGNFAAGQIYATGSGHGEGTQGYLIQTADSGAATSDAPEPSFEDMLASADAAKGEKVFSKCKACHKVDGNNATGPHLDGVVGRAVDTAEGFNYSGALEAKFDTWTPEHLNTFLTNPKEAAPGTKMTFAGLKKAEDRANVIAYLQSLSQ